MLQVRCRFAASLLSYRLNPKERSIIDGVVMPMLRMLIPLVPNTSFQAHSIPKVASHDGRNPEVDIVVQLVNMESDTINIAPLEAKTTITRDNIAHLFRLFSAEELRHKSQVGFLINDSKCAYYVIAKIHCYYQLF